ncbi:MAG: protease inhibitor I42 family protein [Dehalococcoidales bacterium]|nr:protease inhibitor I42 family protein [Dehalococcoidales bacterium]
MKKIFTILVLPLLLVSFISSGCKSETNTPASVAPLDDGTKSVTLAITGADFETTPNLVKTIEVVYPGSVIVSLDSNQTTGFSWTATPGNSNPEVISQFEHNYVAPENTGIVGAAGKEVWTLKPLKQGSAVLTFEYSQPWEGGTKAARTLQLTVNVK